MVHRRGTATVKLELVRRSEGLADPCNDLTHSLFDHVQHLQGERPQRALYLAGVGNHIDRLTREDGGKRQHRRIDPALVAGDLLDHAGRPIRPLLRQAEKSGRPFRRKARVFERCLAADSGIAVWPSWPQACLLPT